MATLHEHRIACLQLGSPLYAVHRKLTFSCRDRVVCPRVSFFYVKTRRLTEWRQRTMGCWASLLLHSTQVDDNETDFSLAGNVERRLISGERVLQISKADFTVSSVLDKIRRGKLDLRPSYQREYVWDKKTASKLIESLLLNIPLPTMFFHEKSQGLLEVVDGKQRLTSIWCYMEEEKFPDGSDFALSGLDVLEKLNGRRYSELDDSLREVMCDFALNVHTISRNSDDVVVFEVFERLNMGSTQLNEQELRNCVFQGSYNDFLNDMAQHSAMLKAFRQDAPHKRMKDREFILRFFCLRRGGVDKFTLPAKNWLNEEMRCHKNLDGKEKREMALDFSRCINLSTEVFGDHVFRLPRGLKYDVDVNVCLWDTVMLGFLNYKDVDLVLSNKQNIAKALHKLLVEDEEFRGYLFSIPRALKFRSQRWTDILQQILGPPQ
ncbi:hypothetical protein L7F22_035566 [Adiantum nelumboides]|nr:hypothetical protein [Adiantum nelumboides]